MERTPPGVQNEQRTQRINAFIYFAAVSLNAPLIAVAAPPPPAGCLPSICRSPCPCGSRMDNSPSTPVIAAISGLPVFFYQVWGVTERTTWSAAVKYTRTHMHPTQAPHGSCAPPPADTPLGHENVWCLLCLASALPMSISQGTAPGHDRRPPAPPAGTARSRACCV